MTKYVGGNLKTTERGGGNGEKRGSESEMAETQSGNDWV
jgi:hypothetical protein